MAKLKNPPDGYTTLQPYLCIDGAADAIDFYKKVFGATERMRMPGPDGRIGHAELQLGDSVLMLADEFPDMGFRSPKHLGGSPVNLTIYVDDVDTVIKGAVAAGATVRREPEDQFYGDRAGQIEDPFGHSWSVMTHIEDVAPEEMARRAAEMSG